MTIDRFGLLVGSVRLASGISFLVDPLRANRFWGDPDKPTPTAQLLLRSMGYRDALIGGLLAVAALRGKNTRGWFLASAGADAADLVGGMSVHHEMKRSQQLIGMGGAALGFVAGLWGAARATPMRPQHVHFWVHAGGYEPLITQVFLRDDPYIERDAVFAVQDSLLADFERHEPGTAPDGTTVDEPFVTLDWILTLAASTE